MLASACTAAIFAAAVSIWGFIIYGYGDIRAQAEVVFFLGITMIACVFCLAPLPPAALSVTAIGVLPYTVFFSVVDGGRFRSVVVNLAVVSLSLVVTILRNYRQFARLVASQRALAVEHAKTLRLADENSRLANLDPLTGLPNRRLFILKLAECCADPAAVQVAIAFIDFDGFKNVNDDFGHQIGDQLIAEAANALASRLPAGALFARLGGDEFAALSAGPEAESKMLAFAATARECLREAVRIGTHLVHVGASIGVASVPAGGCDALELLRRADVAMYRVKTNGKDGVLLYVGEFDLERRRIAALSDEIRAGLANDEFEMHYQPIVEAATGEMFCIEALLRWPRRPGGPLGPDVFIPVAESEGLIHALGLFALRRACEEACAFGHINLNVNVSPAQFGDAGFEDEVAAVLAETGFPPSRLRLEVTEGYLIDNPARASAVISAVKNMGSSFVLDDFGTGYASIAYLQKYGFDAIKIDRSICSRICFDEKARVLVTGVVYLASGLDMTVTAEGVETPEQAQMLRLAGCQRLQGYLYSKPKPMKQLSLESALFAASA